MSCAPEPVVILVSLAARAFSRSVTFSTAFLAVGEQTPLEQVALLVGCVEMTNLAFAICDHRSIAAVNSPARVLFTVLDRPLMISPRRASIRKRIRITAAAQPADKASHC